MSVGAVGDNTDAGAASTEGVKGSVCEDDLAGVREADLVCVDG